MATAASAAAARPAGARARARGLGSKRNAIASFWAVPSWKPTRASPRATAATADLPSLTSESTWRLQFEFFSGKDPSKTEPDRTVVAKVRFVLDEGYEPPQGFVEIVSDDENLFADFDTVDGAVLNPW